MKNKLLGKWKQYQADHPYRKDNGLTVERHFFMNLERFMEIYDLGVFNGFTLRQVKNAVKRVK